MCNCGKKRTELKQQSTINNRNIQNTIQQPVIKKESVLFQYTGVTALTVTGSITRKTYRFNFPNSIVSVDFIDAPAMKAVPVLRKVT